MKTIYDLLENKQKKRVPFRKTEEYSFFTEHKAILSKFPRFSFLASGKDEFMVMRANVIINSYLNKVAIENEMANFLEYKKTGQELDHIRIINSLKELLVDEPYLQEGKEKIYIPVFSRAINMLYYHEPEKLLEEPYIDLKENFIDTCVDPFETYGPNLFNSNFSRLLKIATNGKEIAYFHYDTNTIYIINSQARLDSKIVLFDKYIKRPNYSHMIERIAPVMDAYFANDRNKMVNALHDQGFISSKLLYMIHKRRPIE